MLFLNNLESLLIQDVVYVIWYVPQWYTPRFNRIKNRTWPQISLCEQKTWYRCWSCSLKLEL